MDNSAAQKWLLWQIQFRILSLIYNLQSAPLHNWLKILDKKIAHKFQQRWCFKSTSWLGWRKEMSDEQWVECVFVCVRARGASNLLYYRNFCVNILTSMKLQALTPSSWVLWLPSQLQWNRKTGIKHNTEFGWHSFFVLTPPPSPLSVCVCAYLSNTDFKMCTILFAHIFCFLSI